MHRSQSSRVCARPQPSRVCARPRLCLRKPDRLTIMVLLSVSELWQQTPASFNLSVSAPLPTGSLCRSSLLSLLSLLSGAYLCSPLTAAALASTLVTGRLISAHLTATPFMDSFLSKISRSAHKLTRVTWYRSEHAVSGSKDG